MLKIRINGAPINFYARLQAEDEWIARCLDPTLGEFPLRKGDVLELWWEEAGVWVPTWEGDLAELAVAECEYESKGKN